MARGAFVLYLFLMLAPFLVSISAQTVNWVAVGNNVYTVLVSEDGINWTRLSNGPFSRQGFGVAYSPTQGRWVIAGDNDQLGPALAYSTDGLKWTPAPSAPFTQRGRNVAYSTEQNRWVAAGSGTHCFAHSADGMAWIGDGCPTDVTEGAAVAYSAVENRWVAMTLVNLAATPKIYRSTDGIAWVAATNDAMTSTYSRHVAYSASQSRWLGAGGGTPSLIYSDDGADTWTAVAASPFGASDATSISYSEVHGAWVATSFSVSGNTIARSSDGVNWDAKGVTAIDGAAYGAAYSVSQDRWVVVGEGTNDFAYSDDGGVTWTGTGGTALAANVLAVATRDAVQCALPSCQCVAYQCQLTQNGAISLSVSTTVYGSLRLTAADTLQLAPGAVLSVAGNATLENTKLFIDLGTVDPQGQIEVPVLALVAAAPGGGDSTSRSISGQFADTVTLTHASCTAVTGQTQYTAQGISVLVDFAGARCDDDKSPNRRQAAIIGASVGATVIVGVSLALLVVFVAKRQREKYTDAANNRIKNQTLQDTRDLSTKPTEIV